MHTLDLLWPLTGLPPQALAHARLSGHDPVLPSSFAVGAAAQAGIAAAALAACELGHLRGQLRQDVAVDATHAALECTSWFSVNGVVPDMWDAYSGLYPCRDGHVRIHANFAHHRDGALALLGLDAATATKADVVRALQAWDAEAFETAAAERGLVVAALRTRAQWEATAQAQAVAAQPLFTVTRVGDGPPLPLPKLTAGQRPLTGVRVLDLTRILAGPVGTRMLAGYGADVLMVNGPHLPNIAAIADLSQGKRSCLLDLNGEAGRTVLRALVQDAHVFVQGYRPGGLAARGFAPHELARLRPGLVTVSLSAWGTDGPWAARRGFDSLVQTAAGFNHAEGVAFGDGQPRALPMQALDHVSGHLIALGAAAALHRQQREGGAWHVQVALAQTGHWLWQLPRVVHGFAAQPPAREPWLEAVDSGFGRLVTLRHSAQLARTPATWERLAMPPGTHLPSWAM
ncbi:MAG: CoA transferase [Proteobacteria bacterium]|nr:CoA transferase [Pseudomonadota bacterium]